MKLSRCLVTVCWLAVGSGCPGADPPAPLDGGRDARATVQSDVGGDACVPTACPAGACGQVPDGCGAMQTCSGGCACDPVTFLTTCPERACEVATGCAAGGTSCTYEPITCNFARCECPAGTSCNNTDPRFCGDACGETVCDPRPTTTAGVTRFANACVPTAEAACGLCGLGRLSCGGTGALACSAPLIPGLTAGTAECDGSRVTASLVYFDARYTGDDSDGSRIKPFRDFDAAVAAASLRGARAIILGGIPTITHGLNVVDGISLVGGYTGMPDWAPSTVARPVFIESTPVTDLAGRHLVGLTARNLTLPTAIFHIDVRTADLTGTDSASNVGAVLENAGLLALHDVRITVGNAANGADGAAGVVGIAGNVGAGGSPSVSDYCPGGFGFMCFPANPVCTQRGQWSATGPGAAGGASTACPLGASASGGNGGRVLSGQPFNSRASGSASGASTGGDTAAPNGVSATPATTAAATGALLPATLSLASGFPSVRVAGDGRGAVGASGGGGGGGASGMVATPVECDSLIMTGRYPATGGGGGSGGCGGAPGLGGSAGGWVYGIVTITSEAVVLDGVVLALGTPGVGGAGGTGGMGGPGGGGGAGIDGSGAGGSGARGQQGGRGATGACGVQTPVLFSGAAPDVEGVMAGASTVTATNITAATSGAPCP